MFHFFVAEVIGIFHGVFFLSIGIEYGTRGLQHYTLTHPAQPIELDPLDIFYEDNLTLTELDHYMLCLFESLFVVVFIISICVSIYLLVVMLVELKGLKPQQSRQQCCYAR